MTKATLHAVTCVDSRSRILDEEKNFPELHGKTLTAFKRSCDGHKENK